MKIRVHSKKYCVYSHSIDGCIFYVGKGRAYRSLECGRRNKLWEAKVGGGCFDVKIHGWFDTSKEAVIEEARLIREYKPECNQLMAGYKNHARNKLISTIHSGKTVSDATKAKISSAMKGAVPWNAGGSCSDAQVTKLRAAARCRKVLRVDTGDIYQSARLAAKENDIPWGTMKGHLSGVLSHARGLEFSYVE